MPEPSVSPNAIYQLRVVLRGVSPLIWRRLLVVSETSLGELHEILRSAFGWSGEHLHRFLIHGVAYGIPHVGGSGWSRKWANEQFCFVEGCQRSWDELPASDGPLTVKPLHPSRTRSKNSARSTQAHAP